MVLIMDKASIHESNDLKMLKRAFWHKFNFVPPCSPQFNTIVEIFLKRQNYIKRSNCVNFEALSVDISSIRFKITNAGFISYFNHMKHFIVGAIGFLKIWNYFI